MKKPVPLTMIDRSALSNFCWRTAISKSLFTFVLVFTVNSALFLLLIGHSMSEVRPWTLLTPTYSHSVGFIYLLWQLFMIATISQLLFSTYKEFKIIIHHYTQQLYRALDTRRQHSSMVAYVWNTTAILHQIVLAPFHYRRQIFIAAQLLVLLLVAWFIWMAEYLSLLNLTNLPVININRFLIAISKLAINPNTRHQFTLAAWLAIATIVLLVIVIKCLAKYLSPTAIDEDHHESTRV